MKQIWGIRTNKYLSYTLQRNNGIERHINDKETVKKVMCVTY